MDCTTWVRCVKSAWLGACFVFLGMIGGCMINEKFDFSPILTEEEKKQADHVRLLEKMRLEYELKSPG